MKAMLFPPSKLILLKIFSNNLYNKKALIANRFENKMNHGIGDILNNFVIKYIINCVTWYKLLIR